MYIKLNIKYFLLWGKLKKYINAIAEHCVNDVKGSRTGLGGALERIR